MFLYFCDMRKSKQNKRRYDSNNYEKFAIKYLFIFSTKYRRKCLEPIRDYILYFMKLTENKDFTILIQEIDKDHIHLLVSASPRITPYEIVSRLKQKSVFYIWKVCPDYLKRYYWYRKHILWTRGYFCSTIGEVSEEAIRYYIENQG